MNVVKELIKYCSLA